MHLHPQIANVWGRKHLSFNGKFYFYFCFLLRKFNKTNLKFYDDKILHHRLQPWQLLRWQSWMLSWVQRTVMCFQMQPPLFLKVSQIPHENTWAGVSFLKGCRPASLFHVWFSLYPIINFNLIKSYCLYKLLSK